MINTDDWFSAHETALAAERALSTAAPADRVAAEAAMDVAFAKALLIEENLRHTRCDSVDAVIGKLRIATRMAPDGGVDPAWAMVRSALNDLVENFPKLAHLAQRSEVVFFSACG